MIRKIAIIAITILALATTYNTHAQNKITVESANPVVVKTFPQSGDTAVDSNIKEIRVTFSKDMMTKQMWSWVMVSEDTFPKITGQIKYLNDKRTCVAPVSIEPGKTYAVWFNSQRQNAFKDINKKSAIPYLLVFKTKDK